MPSKNPSVTTRAGKIKQLQVRGYADPQNSRELVFLHGALTACAGTPAQPHFLHCTSADFLPQNHQDSSSASIISGPKRGWKLQRQKI